MFVTSDSDLFGHRRKNCKCVSANKSQFPCARVILSNLKKEVTMASQEGKAPEMTEEELQVLIEEYERRRAVIDSDEKTVDFAKKKNQAWEKITEAVNACSNHKRTITQVKTKIKNLKTRAKSRYVATKRLSGQTGGGPPPKQLSAVEERLAAMYENSAGWSGVPGGAESSAIPSLELEPRASSSQEESSFNFDRLSAPVTEAIDEPSVKKLRKLQMRALETQIAANEAVVKTCDNINNVLIPHILCKLGGAPDMLNDLIA